MNSLEELIPSYKMEVIKWNFHANCWKVVTQRAGRITKNVEVTKIKWKQASRGVFRKRCSVYNLQIYWKTHVKKYSFIKITLRQGRFPINFLHISRITFHKNTSGGLLPKILTRHFADFVSKFYSDNIFGLLQHYFFIFMHPKYKEAQCWVYNFFSVGQSRTVNLVSSMPLTMSWVDSENKCEFQNMLWEWGWANHAMEGGWEKSGYDWELALLPLSNFPILECMLHNHFNYFQLNKHAFVFL